VDHGELLICQQFLTHTRPMDSIFALVEYVKRHASLQRCRVLESQKHITISITVRSENAIFRPILTGIVKCELPDIAITYSTTVSMESVPNNYV